MQDELAQLSDNSTHILAEHAGHVVHDDDPEVVARALRDAVARGREWWDPFRPR